MRLTIFALMLSMCFTLVVNAHDKPKPKPPEPQIAQQQEHSERRWCQRDGLRGLACVGAVLFGGYAVYSWDAKKDEQLKFGVKVQGEK